jgi:HNH endonuclease
VIFAKLDAVAWRTPEFMAGGLESFGFWCAALAYLRDIESEDGRLDDAVIGLIFGLGKDIASAHANRLVEFGLFGRETSAYVLLGYSETNETLEDIEARRANTRMRVAAWRLRAQVIQRDGYICQICNGSVDKSDIDIDHIVPVSKGGPSTLSNLRVTHSRCNRVRGNREAT